ncbi:hypothetical protein GQ54DRAFT_95987 [Martensiomyces pterosporus]|nr:hypothetical protein GQ54DRAFT_95987 [Martensiomyces pterosporus]
MRGIAIAWWGNISILSCYASLGKGNKKSTRGATTLIYIVPAIRLSEILDRVNTTSLRMRRLGGVRRLAAVVVDSVRHHEWQASLLLPRGKDDQEHEVDDKNQELEPSKGRGGAVLVAGARYVAVGGVGIHSQNNSGDEPEPDRRRRDNQLNAGAVQVVKEPEPPSRERACEHGGRQEDQVHDAEENTPPGGTLVRVGNDVLQCSESHGEQDKVKQVDTQCGNVEPVAHRSNSGIGESHYRTKDY